MYRASMLLIILLLLTPCVVNEMSEHTLYSNIPQFETKSFITIQNNSIKGIASPYTVDREKYNNFLDIEIILRLEQLFEEIPIFYRIFNCESKFDPNVCNKEFGCKAGMGLGQIIPSTLQDCEKWLGRKLDPFNPTDNIDCCIELHKRRGRLPWKQSENCWNQYY